MSYIYLVSKVKRGPACDPLEHVAVPGLLQPLRTALSPRRLTCSGAASTPGAREAAATGRAGWARRGTPAPSGQPGPAGRGGGGASFRSRPSADHAAARRGGTDLGCQGSGSGSRLGRGSAWSVGPEPPSLGVRSARSGLRSRRRPCTRGAGRPGPRLHLARPPPPLGGRSRPRPRPLPGRRFPPRRAARPFRCGSGVSGR